MNLSNGWSQVSAMRLPPPMPGGGFMGLSGNQVQFHSLSSAVSQVRAAWGDTAGQEPLQITAATVSLHSSWGEREKEGMI